MEEIMSRVQATLMYIKCNPLDVITMICGMIAATLVAFKFPQPYLGMAFWLYVVSAACAVVSNRRKKQWPYVILFSYFFIIDSVGVYRWWPW